MEAPRCKPSTLSMGTKASDYDALDRSATTARFDNYRFCNGTLLKGFGQNAIIAFDQNLIKAFLCIT